MLAVAATCLVAALVAAPTAGAASAKASASPTAKASVTKKRLARDIASVRRRTNAARRSIRTLGQTLAALQGALNGVKTSGEGTQGQLNTVLAAVPQVLDALTQLRDGSLALKAGLEQAGAGLLALKTGLETLAAGTTRLGDFVQADEYGAVRAFVRPAASTDEADFDAIPGISANSANIPDNGQGALVSASVPHLNTTGGPVDVTLRAAIRSNESDGAATGPPAGQVGGIFYAKCAAIPGQAPTSCPAGVEPGAIVCAPSGPPPPQNFGPLVGSQPLENIQTKDPATSFVAPTAEDDVNPTGETANADCTLPGNGLYELTFAVQFFDFPTSTTPGPTE